ncbi:MAG: copper-binding protein [Alphaproteobacteria bacterium]|nr:copper-binding protein [Alphaproteobacteria bacterium]MBU0873226.1 copper-binding protein [Alphaproteobacteria bacterium]MBU1400534.1 copper-binding protein [Alphaproteobacteria bacterium]MBU1592854.1 copper-binding protein [Alphaproteobacteria bacterium]MBU1792368.1 copper-binding protein [Alphaproteobacteria bacterium]
MKMIIKTIAIIAMSLTLGGTAAAVEYTKGEVTKIDAKQKKLTIRHEELKNLDMPPMKMVFVVADEAMLEQLEEGQRIEFVAEKVNGRLTVTEIK